MALQSHLSPARRHARNLFSSALVLLPLAGLAEQPLAPPAPPPEVSAPPQYVLAPAPRALMLPKAFIPATPEPDEIATGSALANPFARNATAAVSTGQTLIAPVTVNAKTSTDALTATQTGAGRSINAVVNNGANASSAIRGLTNGKGAGVNGVNSGINGQAGKFEITNAASAQPSLLVSTNGTGYGVQATLTNAATFDTPAVFGQHNAHPGYGVGVLGVGGYIGVRGTGESLGVYGESVSGNGVYGRTSSGSGVFGYSSKGAGIYGDSGGGPGVSGYSVSLAADSFGVKGYSAHYAGVYGNSEVAIGVYGYSQSNFGVVGRSDTNYAGVFYGPVSVSGKLVAASVTYTSDREKKQDFAAVDSADVLSRVAAMPITAWDYKDRPAERHMGPMAQDFHAAFGLGADDKHIDVVDGIGVSLAAIQELQRQLLQRDARIQALEDKLMAQREDIDARIAAQVSAAVARATAQP